MKMLYKIVLFFALLISASGVFAQQNQVETAIDLYKRGENRQAVDILERLSKQKETKTEVKVWNYLGLAYIELNDLKKARKALEKANSLSPQNSAVKTNLAYAYLLSNKLNNAQSELNQAIQLDANNFLAYYIRGTSFLWEKKFDQALSDAEKTIALQSNYSSGYILKADILTAKFGRQVTTGTTPKEASNLLQQAVEVLESCLKNCQNNANLQMQQERLESLKVFYEYFNRNKTSSADLNTVTDVNAVPTTESNTTPIKILTKPQASYTDRARQAGISGTITVYVLFGANGKILNIIPLNTLGYGLDEQVFKVVRQIKFEPMTRDGKPVSVVKMVQYTFTIY